MTINRRLPLFFIVIYLSSHSSAFSAEHGTLDQERKSSPLALLFEEAILADNATAVRRHASELPDQERYQQLINWVLPSQSDSTIRMYSEFTQTNPAPANRLSILPAGELRRPFSIFWRPPAS